jgi:uncharacterized membrane protein
VTADGSVVVGASFVKFDAFYEPVVHAFRWTEHMGMVDLETASEVTVSSYASDITPNGNVIVGRRGEEVFRWTEETGMVGLGNLSGRSIWPSAVSADGNIIVGQSTHGCPFAFVNEAFIWTPHGGMENLKGKLLSAEGSGLDRWQLTAATAISADGRTIVGNGINPLGQNEAWIATLPIPEPSTLVFLSVAIAGYCGKRFR